MQFRKQKQFKILALKKYQHSVLEEVMNVGIKVKVISTSSISSRR